MAEITTASGGSWHTWVRSQRKMFEKKMWPGGRKGESPIPFYALDASRLCHILRRLQREFLTGTDLYDDLAAEARKRGLRWEDTHFIQYLELPGTGPVVRGTVCVNPMGVEVNVIDAQIGSSRLVKCYIKWEDLEDMRRQAAHNQGLEDTSLKATDPNERFLDL